MATERGRAAVYGMECTIWEQAWYLRGMEPLMCDMMGGEETATWLFERVCEISCERARLAARAGADIIALGDDIGMESAPMMSLDLYREWIQPRLARVIAAAHQTAAAIPASAPRVLASRAGCRSCAQ